MLLKTLPARPSRTTTLRPFRAFEDAFAPLADVAFRFGPFEALGTRFGPNLTATWRNGSFVVTVDVPGVAQEALSVSVADRTLVLEAKTEELTWSQRMPLPRQLDVDAITAEYANGRLTVTIPTKPEARPRKVEITVGAPARAQLDAGAQDTESSDESATTEENQSTEADVTA